LLDRQEVTGSIPVRPTVPSKDLLQEGIYVLPLLYTD
jgi:hypothetical protein